jgi:hypothetical protein
MFIPLPLVILGIAIYLWRDYQKSRVPQPPKGWLRDLRR